MSPSWYENAHFFSSFIFHQQETHWVCTHVISKALENNQPLNLLCSKTHPFLAYLMENVTRKLFSFTGWNFLSLFKESCSFDLTFFFLHFWSFYSLNAKEGHIITGTLLEFTSKSSWKAVKRRNSFLGGMRRTLIDKGSAASSPQLCCIALSTILVCMTHKHPQTPTAWSVSVERVRHLKRKSVSMCAYECVYT